MEVFSVFATLSLVDMISGPLGRVKNVMKGMDGSVSALGRRMGGLAVAMGPAALAAGTMLGAFGMAANKAMAFESAMADVAKVVDFATDAELQAMNKTIMDMAGRIPMAADGLAAIVAAAGQSGVAKEDLTEFAEQAAKMGVAFDLTGEQAGTMMAAWRAGMNLSLDKTYELADAVNYLSNKMNATAPALGEVIQRVGAVAQVAGLAETQVAALGAAFLSAGASPEIAATALKSFTTTLVKGAAMSKTQAAAFASIGLSATQMAKDMQTDAQGTIFKVLNAIAEKPKELQTSLLTEMFGQESLGAIAPLLANMGNLSQAFELVGDKNNYAKSMQGEFDTRSKTTANTLQLLSNKLTNLAITVGNAFLPSIGWAADKLGGFVDMLRSVAETRAGQWLLQLAAALGTVIVAITAGSGAMWAFSAAGPMIAKALAPAKAALLGLGAPVYAVIAVLGLLYAAYKTNFGGMADYLDGIWEKITLTVKGVIAVFQSLKGSSGEIRGELAAKIKAAGLTGLVTTVSRVVFRIQAMFNGFVQALKNTGKTISSMFDPVRSAVSKLMQGISSLFGLFDGNELSGQVTNWENFGQVLGYALAAFLAIKAAIIGVQGVMTVISAVTKAWTAAQWLLNAALSANPIGLVIIAITALVAAGLWLVQNWDMVSAYLSGIWESISTWASEKWNAVKNSITETWNSIAAGVSGFGASVISGIQSAWDAVSSAAATAWEGIKGIVSGAWNSIVGGIAGFGASLLAGITEAWNAVLSFFNGLNLFESGAKLLSTFIDGIKSMASSVVESVSGVLSSVREYLPFSDAHVGPLSQLTLSGSRMMTTLAEGVTSAQGGLVSKVSGALADVGGAIRSWWNGLGSPAKDAAREIPNTLANLDLPAVQQNTVPNLPPLRMEAELPAMPSLKVAAPEMPEAPVITAPEMPSMPEIAAPEIAVPNAPLFPTSENRNAKAYAMREGNSGGTTITITINGLSLPDVKNGEDFVASLQSMITEYGA